MRLRRVGIADDSDLLDGQEGSSFASGNAFGTIVVATQSDVVADTSNDTLTLVAGTGITITTDAGADSVTITNSSSGGVSDGDKGDITVSGSGATWTVDNDAITFAKIQNITADRLLGRHTAGSGDAEEVRVDGGIEFSGTGTIQTSAFTGDVTKSAGGTATTIANDAVTYAKMQNVSAASRLLGRGDSGSGDPQEITLGSGLSMTGTTLSATGSSGDVTGPASATDNGIARFDLTTGKIIQNSGVTITDDNGLVLPAGSATSAPITLTSQTLMTTPADGSIEMDDNCIYATTDAGNRGYIEVNHFIRADSTRTFTSNTLQQAIFTTPANGALTLETGTYLFEGLIAMTSMSGTSGNGKFSLIGAGTATLGAILWQAYGNDNTAETTGAATGGGWHVIATQTATNIATAGTGTGLCFLVKGTFEVTVAGTIIPSFAQTTAAAAVVSVGSYFKCNRVGSTSVTSVGQWT